MDRQTYSSNRREFIAGAVGVGAAGMGLESVAGRAWATQQGTGEASDLVDIVVRFEPAAGAGAETLQQHARETQRPFETFAAGRSDVSVERQFWAANAALVSVDVGSVARATILNIEHVTTVHPNYSVRAHGTADGSSADTAGTGEVSRQVEETDVAYHLEEMDVPQAREIHGTRGEGVDVAVLDTGIDTSGHEELAASLERGGWAEFDEDGTRVDSEPNAETDFPQAGHGTAISGAIAGGTTDDGTSYGVAPDVNLYKAQMVSQPPEGIRTLSVFAGIEWAIEQGVDVLSMSLGLPQYNRAFIEPVRNAIESGILVVAGTGNSGRETSFSPANIPGVLSVGGIDDDREMYEDSGGERIDTERYWDDAAFDSWPREYVVPDVTAPAVDVLGAVLDGKFARNNGTSFAAPCVAGVAALAIAATDADNEAVKAAITETARHPAAEDAFDIDPGRDDRYGRGIVSAMAAISRLRASETLSGTVTDADGTPIEGVAVASEAGPSTETDSQGEYELTVPPIPQPIGAVGPGFDASATRLNPADTDTQSFQLERTEDLAVELSERSATRVDPGTEATATFEVANVDTVVVESETNGLLDQEELTLDVAGTGAAFGEPVSIDPDRTRITVGVSVPESVFIGQFQLSYEFTGNGTSVSGEGHLVHAHPDPFVTAPENPPTLQAPIDLVAPGTTIELTEGDGRAVAGSGDSAGLVIDKPVTLTAADGATPTVQFSNDGADQPAAVLVSANDVTISGLVVDATGATTGVQVARPGAIAQALPQPSGVTVRDLTVSGADTAVRAGQAPALRVTNNEVTAATAGISVGRRLPFRDSTTVTSRSKTTVRDNSVTDVETGIAVAGQVAAIDGNDISNAGTAGIRLGTQRFLSRHWGADIGPIRSNTITGANQGIVVSGVMTRPVEGNTLSDIAETALVIDGAVLAPVRANSVDGARTGLSIGDDAEVGTLSDNEFNNIQQPGDEGESGETDTTPSDDQDGTAEETTARAETEPATTPEDSTDTGADGTSDSSPGGSGPGFGLGSALASLGGAGYLLQRRLRDDDPDAE
jgi:hypothetical protein